MSDPYLIVGPVLLPMAAAVVLLLFRGQAAVQRYGLLATMVALCVGSAMLLVRVAGSGEVLVMHFGGWRAPLGISFYVDLLSASLVLVAALVGMGGALFAAGEIGTSIWRRGYGVFYCLLMAGIGGAFLTGDAFNMFVWFEVLLMSSFALLILGRRRFTFGGATMYVVINMISSICFLSGLGILYGTAGSLNFVDLAAKFSEEQAGGPLILSSLVFFLLAFGIKAGVFPLYFWLPPSYPQTGFATAAVFGGLLTKVGVYAMFRMFGMVFGFLSDITSELFLIIGVATIFAGGLGACSQGQVRRILVFLIVAHIGYMFVALSLFTEGGHTAAIYYILHDILVKTNLFLLAGMIVMVGGTERIADLGGMMKKVPWLAGFFFVAAMTLAGIPPFSGFLAKFLIVRELLAEGWTVTACLVLGGGLLTLLALARLWSEVFWKGKDRPLKAGRLRGWYWVAVVFMTLLSVGLAVFVGPLYELAAEAAEQLKHAVP
jgi:multicomponent Na+:H+ antiporter subunit D